MHPLISCLCPTKNGPSTVKKAIECFNSQTYPNKELILVTDERNIYLDTLESLAGGNIKLVKAPRGSVIGKLRNLSVDNANGDYIATWDDDDISFEDRLTEQYKAIIQSGKEVCYLTNTLIKDHIDNTVGLSRKGMCVDCTMLARKSSFPRYNDKASYPNVEDVPVKKHYLDKKQVVWLNKPHLYVYNIHGRNTCDYRIQKKWIDKII